MVVTRAFSAAAALACGCTIGGVNALPPVDGGLPGDDAALPADAGAPDAAPCDVMIDTDGDGADDCAEAGDGDPFTDPQVFNGFHAVIGDRPEVTGGCDALDDHAEMETRFDAPMQAQDVYAGWEFETDADRYDDPSYGFAPNWPTAADGRFSVRYAGRLRVERAGRHCFGIDIGATGTGIISGKNMCAQLYVGGGPSWLVETGYQADSAGAAQACVDLAAGEHAIDVVFWYFNVFEIARLRVRRCFGGAADCEPDAPIEAADLQAGL